MRSKNAAWAVALVAVWGCDLSTGPDRPAVPAIWTDRAEYIVRGVELGWQTEIPYTFTNRTEEPVYMPNCGGAVPFRLDRWQGTRWEPAWHPILPLCLSVPIAVEPGGVFRDTIGYFVAYGDDPAAPGPAGSEIEGTYRIVLEGLVHDPEPYAPGGGGEVPLRYRSSNPFTMRVRP